MTVRTGMFVAAVACVTEERGMAVEGIVYVTVKETGNDGLTLEVVVVRTLADYFQQSSVS